MGKQTKNVNENKGRILKVKYGYNPNSSSMGSVIFALPVALFGVTVGFGVVSAMIMTFFVEHEPKEIDAPDKANENEKRNTS